MDFSSLKDQVTNLSLYDIKAGVRKVQNGKSLSLDMVDSTKKPAESCLFIAVMNYTEMESKARLIKSSPIEVTMADARV